MRTSTPTQFEERNTAARSRLVDAVELALERLRGAAPDPRAIAVHVSSAFELVRFDEHDRPLFAVRVASSLPPRTCEPVPEGPDATAPVPAAPFEPPPNPMSTVLGLARRLMPIAVLRHRWLIREMVRLGYPQPSLMTLQLLSQDELATIHRLLVERAGQ